MNRLISFPRDRAMPPSELSGACSICELHLDSRFDFVVRTPARELLCLDCASRMKARYAPPLVRIGEALHDFQ